MIRRYEAVRFSPGPDRDAAYNALAIRLKQHARPVSDDVREWSWDSGLGEIPDRLIARTWRPPDDPHGSPRRVREIRHEILQRHRRIRSLASAAAVTDWAGGAEDHHMNHADELRRIAGEIDRAYQSYTWGPSADAESLRLAAAEIGRQFGTPWMPRGPMRGRRMKWRAPVSLWKPGNFASRCNARTIASACYSGISPTRGPRRIG